MESEGTKFENEVRSIARALYPYSDGGSSELWLGRERDGVFFDRDQIIVIESTVSRKSEKIRDDARKTAELIKKLRRDFPEKFSRGILITKNEPTADQIEAAKKYAAYNIKILSFELFRKQLVDAEKYISLRERYSFGSARDYDSDTFEMDRNSVIPLDLIVKNSKNIISVSDITNQIDENNKPVRLLLLGDFGAGKSTTLLQIWWHVAERTLRGADRRLPIFLNLRDHSGQEDFAEGLERHAKKIGYPRPSDLVSAFRSGSTAIFLDGIDELAPLIRLTSDSKKLRQIRRKAVQMVRSAIEQAPLGTPIILSSRSQYFDSEADLRMALGLNDEWIICDVNEFSPEQIKQYFDRKGVNSSIPDWLPGRPVLVGYLIGKGFFNHTSPHVTNSAAKAWSDLFDFVCAREASIFGALSGSEIRPVIERLATFAGRSDNGLGPLDMPKIYEAFRTFVGESPDQRDEQQLLRLPGLGPANEDATARAFIDETFADVARAGDVCRFIRSPFNEDWKAIFDENQTIIGDLGAQIAAMELSHNPVSEKLLSTAIEWAAEKLGNSALAFSLIRICLTMESRIANCRAHVSNGYVKDFAITKSDADISGIVIESVLFQNFRIDPQLPDRNVPTFRSCVFLNISGPISRSDVPHGHKFEACDFENYEKSLATTNEIIAADLQPIVKVVCSCLDKLFFQAGSGRETGAFPRGLDPRLRPLVDDALALIRTEGLAEPFKSDGRTIWRPDRTQTGRVRQMLAAPNVSTDPLLKRARSIS